MKTQNEDRCIFHIHFDLTHHIDDDEDIMEEVEKKNLSLKKLGEDYSDWWLGNTGGEFIDGFYEWMRDWRED